MSTPQRRSVQDILTWMRDSRPQRFASLDDLSAHFGVTRDHMLKTLQSLQRYECVKRGGRDHAEWSITELGLVRLEEGRFSESGAFLSAYDERPRAPASVDPSSAEGAAKVRLVEDELDPQA